MSYDGIKKTNSLLGELKTDLVKKLCDLEKSSSGSNEEVIEAINALNQTLQDQIRKDYEITPYCNNGKVTGYVVKILNEQDGTFETIYWDNMQSETTVQPEGSPCAKDGCPGEEVQGIVNDWIGPVPITISGHLYYDSNLLIDNQVNGTTRIPSGFYAVLVLVDTDGSKVVGVQEIAGEGESNAGEFSFAAFSETTYYVYMTINPPSLGDVITTPAPRYLPTYGATGENVSDPIIGNPLGSDGTVDGVSRVFTTTNQDVINVDFGIRRGAGVHLE